MKNSVCALKILLTAMLSAVLLSCSGNIHNIENETENRENVVLNINDEYAETNIWIHEVYKRDDTTPLNNLLTTEYDLQELWPFFENKGLYATLIEGQEILGFKEINERFPIEVTRSAGFYSVYQVRQGGRLYLGWYVGYDGQGLKEPQVFRDLELEAAVYYEKPIDSERFTALIPGISTAREVIDIDPYAEVNVLFGSGPRSFSLLNEDEVVIVYYEQGGGLFEYDDLIVKEVTIVPRSSPLVASVLRYILADDFP